MILGFQIKESPEGDWNPEKIMVAWLAWRLFQIKESPEGDWNMTLKSEQAIELALSN